ncbi:endolytic transglycosylase MltG [Jeotgalibacillus sp. R-1-5s-1]|uniref:endolytic transglycosylase MltG n=1 Tax=Jeotgalibacillus sp. R-1-5s-1 TaxID=2555897 RepID=UPI00106C65A8|nr:endolytic transglycosylase MltG [Jeotgalibacillus sp. R-1-5s-1]TFD92367.1 endolytic transglycosylase MltG [Jeotgalibacillus sp. R-1-5s-1]
MSDKKSLIDQWKLNLQERKKEAKKVRKIVFILSVILLFLTAGLVLGGYSYVSAALEPVDPESEEAIPVEIPIGSSVDSITAELEENGVIKDAQVFKYYLKFNNESEFQAGTYEFTPAMTLDEITQSLKTGKIYHEPIFNVTIPEGLTLEQIAGVIEENTNYTEEEFMEKVTDPAFIQTLKDTYPELITADVDNENIKMTLEGYLFPATYPFYEENPSLESIITQMVDAMYNNVSPYLATLPEFTAGDYTGATDGGEGEKVMDVHDVLTMASLLEREATASTDRSMIAGIFYNRLEEGMPLQTDPTVLYAKGEWNDRVLFEDLEIQDPYNTYQNQGLPPGPIAAPGLASIEAALNPEASDYFYFLTSAEDGAMYYSETLEEHEQKAEQYIYSVNEEQASEEEGS